MAFNRGILMLAIIALTECQNGSVFSQLRERIDNAKTPLFSVPSDFPLVCNTSPHYFACAENFLNSVLFCERQPSRDRRNLITGAIRSYAGYLCSEDAKRLAALVEEKDCIKKSCGGAKCFHEILPQKMFLHMLEIYSRTFVPKVEKCMFYIFDQCPSTDPLFSPSSSARKFMTDFKKLAPYRFSRDFSA
ncbi:uncharacterized protein LOC122856212 [Aphidius gifuensis]|uniref:uncharacterized protein LOC122856212 n=1 Tax=Aphidius gifuensis TaxID=684658 RepID=UPI001CDB6B41|nr:uncharacterized protein LOC122856212 [Aphidius gifuensis]